MMLSSCRVFLILTVSVGLLVLQSDLVDGSMSADLALRQGRKAGAALVRPHNNSQRMLQVDDATMQGIDARKKSGQVNKRFDPNQSSERRVRRGSDPIHNRS
ncbi:hypothetical protein Tsubulata_034192 [Turnera subulata]|uniref:Uncharacterized protein n=1 Tax=Turnera subulata TaxID=218843 RepID=A0A9Q0G1I4_9ROSI|nr:hypothetical protein Tsubulata_034192 [Turnera subulata]